MNFAIVRPLRNEIKEQFKIVARIAAEPRYSISNDFEKMRTKKSGTITLDLNNELNNIQINTDTAAIEPAAKKGIFKRIFKPDKN